MFGCGVMGVAIVQGSSVWGRWLIMARNVMRLLELGVRIIRYLRLRMSGHARVSGSTMSRAVTGRRFGLNR